MDAPELHARCGSCCARVSATLRVFTPQCFSMAQLIDQGSVEMCGMCRVFSLCGRIGGWRRFVWCSQWTNCTAQMCVVSGCPVYTTRRFSGIPSRKPKSTPFLRLCTPSVPTRLPLWSWPLPSWRWRRCRRASPVALDRHRNRSFLLFRIVVDLLVAVVDVLDVSVSEMVAFPTSGRFAFYVIVFMQRQILVAVFGVLQPLSSRGCPVVSFKSDAIEKHDL